MRGKHLSEIKFKGGKSLTETNPTEPLDDYSLMSLKFPAPESLLAALSKMCKYLLLFSLRFLLLVLALVFADKTQDK